MVKRPVYHAEPNEIAIFALELLGRTAQNAASRRAVLHTEGTHYSGALKTAKF